MLIQQNIQHDIGKMRTSSWNVEVAEHSARHWTITANVELECRAGTTFSTLKNANVELECWASRTFIATLKNANVELAQHSAQHLKMRMSSLNVELTEYSVRHWKMRMSSWQNIQHNIQKIQGCGFEVYTGSPPWFLIICMTSFKLPGWFPESVSQSS